MSYMGIPATGIWDNEETVSVSRPTVPPTLCLWMSKAQSALGKATQPLLYTHFEETWMTMT